MHFEVFAHLEGEFTLNTYVRFIFSLDFDGMSLVQCVLFNLLGNEAVV